MESPTQFSRECARCGAPLMSWSLASVCWSCMLESTTSSKVSPKLASTATADASPRTSFGDYVLEEEIAHGGMGVVYRATQQRLGRTVAVKVLLLGRHSSDERIERFRREAQSVAALRHPNIVTIHEVGEHEGHYFFSMDYVEGRSLAEKLRAGPLEPRRSAEIACDIARAIDYAHEQGVLHRNLKPSNILLDSLGQVRITDFGLARKLDGSSDLTVTGQMMGTPNYLSPELAADRHSEVGPTSDVYSVGALLYELLTGRPPFLSNSLQETLLRIRDDESVSPRALNPSVDRELEAICLKCLQKNPQRRYASAGALAEDLQRWQCSEPIEARPACALEHGATWVSRHPWRAGGGGTLVLMFLVGFAGISWQGQRARFLHAANLANLECQ